MSKLSPLVCGALLGWSGCVEYTVVGQVDVNPEEVTECDFVPFEDMPQLYEYQCNPVFTTTDEAWARSLGATTFNHTEVLGHPFYQIWYTGIDADDNWSMGYAVSDNGTDWTPHPGNPSWPARAASDWDAGRLQAPSVAWDPNLGGYTMLYGGISEDYDIFGIGLAGSYDGADWFLFDGNPILDLGLPYSGLGYAWPLTLAIGDGRYDAYFGGGQYTDDGPIDIYRISTTSAQGWQAEATRVFRAGDSGDWDDEGILEASVVQLDGVRYLFYSGFGRWVDQSGGVRTAVDAHVGLATSVDGNQWTRLTDDHLPLSKTSSGTVGMVAARAVGSRIHLWVEDYYADIDATGIGYFLYIPD